MDVSKTGGGLQPIRQRSASAPTTPTAMGKTSNGMAVQQNPDGASSTVSEGAKKAPTSFTEFIKAILEFLKSLLPELPPPEYTIRTDHAGSEVTDLTLKGRVHEENELLNIMRAALDKPAGSKLSVVEVENFLKEAFPEAIIHKGHYVPASAKTQFLP